MVSFTENSGVGLLAEGVAMLFMKKIRGKPSNAVFIILTGGTLISQEPWAKVADKQQHY